MRSVFVLLSVGLVGLAGTAAAQAPADETRLGLKAGLNLATLSGTINSSAQLFPGFTLGPMVRFRPSAQGFAVQTELQLSLQGTNEKKPIGPQGQTTVVHRRIAYLNLPVLLRQYVGRHAYLNIGPQLGILLGASDSGSKDVRKLEGGIVGGVGYEFASGWMLDARLNYGLSDINNNSDERQLRSTLGLGGLHNRVIQLSVGKLLGKR
ncbi:porin family protein [Hymenobacter sp. DG01]|uniref:porin family protein n=1 Tax=Hymenobacter sp. DG01 TaxID=2584940 RepID=UPI0015DEF927|nr:porin family protein [Hymenobacter sp. DG01]